MEEYYQDLGISMPKTFKFEGSMNLNEMLRLSPTLNQEPDDDLKECHVYKIYNSITTTFSFCNIPILRMVGDDKYRKERMKYLQCMRSLEWSTF